VTDTDVSVMDSSLVEESVGSLEIDSNADFRIKCKKFVFQALFEKASSVVPSKDIMPVLKNFQVEALEGKVRVVATDLELSVISENEMVEVSRQGMAVFPAKKILDIIREAEDGDMEFNVTNGTATIKVEKATWVLKLQSGDDYPALPDLGELESHVVNRVKFLGAIQAVRYAAAKDTTRPSLMMIDVTNGKMTACDGARFQQADLGDDFPLSLQLPIGAVGDLVRLLRTTDQPDITIGETDFHLVFRVGNDVFIANKLMAQFPNVEELLLRPALSNKQQLLIDREELVAAVKRVRINSDLASSAIVLELSSDQCRVVSKDKFGNSSEETLLASWQSGDRSIAVNHVFLSEMLAMYDGQSCKFLLGEDTKSRKSAVLLIDDESGTTGIINQMRQDWVLE
jgi:DNA polymerase-3 subunit beta